MPIRPALTLKSTKSAPSIGEMVCSKMGSSGTGRRPALSWLESSWASFRLKPDISPLSVMTELTMGAMGSPSSPRSGWSPSNMPSGWPISRPVISSESIAPSAVHSNTSRTWPNWSTSTYVFSLKRLEVSAVCTPFKSPSAGIHSSSTSSRNSSTAVRPMRSFWTSLMSRPGNCTLMRFSPCLSMTGSVTPRGFMRLAMTATTPSMTSSSLPGSTEERSAS